MVGESPLIANIPTQRLSCEAFFLRGERGGTARKREYDSASQAKYNKWPHRPFLLNDQGYIKLLRQKACLLNPQIAVD